MARSKAAPVQAGDYFIKAEDPNRRIWQVVTVTTAVDGIEHARLHCTEGPGGSITIGAGVLCDHRFWQRAQAT